MKKSGDGMGLLSLIRDINQKTTNMHSGEVTVCSDNKSLITECRKKRFKASEYTNNTGAVIEVIRREIAKASIVILAQYSKNKPRPNTEFYQNTGAYLLKKAGKNRKGNVVMLDSEDYCRLVCLLVLEYQSEKEK